ncbi:MAG: hypothetical protein ABFS12_06290 [Bacteroidota bacterium]
MLKSKYLLNVIFTSLLLITTSCIEPPEQFIAPRYDVDLNFPVIDSLITINDFIKNDSNLVISSDPEKLGLLYYVKTDKIESFQLGDNLKIGSMETSTSMTLGSIRIEDSPFVIANVSISDIAPISEGSDAIFPPISTPINANFEEIDDFASADFESGNLELTVNNNLPVPIEFSNIIIRNIGDNSIVAQFPPSTRFVIQPFDSSQVILPINDEHVTSQLKVEGDFTTEGSNGEIVHIPTGAGLTVSLRFTDFILDRVTAILPEQEEIQIDSSQVINDSTKVERAIFEDGRILFTVNNYIDLDINVWFQIDNLKREDGSVYNDTFVIQRNSTYQIFQIESLKGWQLESDNPGELLDELKYSIKVSSYATEDERTITQRDSISVQFNFEDAVVSYVRGLIKPTPFEITESELSIDLGDLENNFSFDSIYINEPSFKLAINSSINLDVILNGKITGISDNISKELPILMELPSLVNAEFDLADYGIVEFINSFTTAGAIPTKFIFSGSGIVNPNYVVGSVSNTDSVFGSSHFELPFDIGIAGGSFIDSLEILDLNLTEEDIESINSILLTVETDNKIPINLIMCGEALDMDGNLLTKIPPDYNLSEYLVIDPPQVDNNGDVLSSQLTTQQIELRASEARQFISSPNIVLSLMFDTPPLNSIDNVKFKSTDNVYFKIYGTINYRVNN